jgi:hypothetical protein
MRGRALVDQPVPMGPPTGRRCMAGPDVVRADVISGEDCTNDDPFALRAGPWAYPDPLAQVGV